MAPTLRSLRVKMPESARSGCRRVSINKALTASSLALLALLCQFCYLSAWSFDKSHAAYSAELGKYVKGGLVDYASWKKSPEPLKRYLQSVADITVEEYASMDKDAQLALWLNAYNAFTIKLVLEHYPINGTKSYYPKSSIRQIDGFWETNSFKVAGRKVTLEKIEHDLLRRDFCDPRTHFAVCCAAKGCAKLQSKAFTGENLDEMLAEATKEFLSDKNNVRFDFGKSEVHVTQLFKWFPLDFSACVGMGKRFPPPTDDEIVLAYVVGKAPPAVRRKVGDEKQREKWKVVYEPYDWSLNDQSASQAHGKSGQKRRPTAATEGKSSKN